MGRESSLKGHLTSLKEHLTNEESAREKAGGGKGVCVCVHVCVNREPGGIESVSPAA